MEVTAGDRDDPAIPQVGGASQLPWLTGKFNSETGYQVQLWDRGFDGCGAYRRIGDRPGICAPTLI